LFIPSVETEHLLRFRLSSSHAAVCVHRFLKGTISIVGGFKTPVSKPGAELVGDLPYLLRRQSIAVDSKQPGEVVIKVDEIETDARISAA
jgi:hypothetical protein